MDLKGATELIMPEREPGWRFSKEPGPGRQPLCSEGMGDGRDINGHREIAPNTGNSACVEPTTSPISGQDIDPAELWLALGGVEGLLYGLNDAATRAGAVSVLSGPFTDLLSRRRFS